MFYPMKKRHKDLLGKNGVVHTHTQDEGSLRRMGVETYEPSGDLNHHLGAVHTDVGVLIKEKGRRMSHSFERSRATHELN